MHNFIFKKVSSKEEMEKSYAIRTKVFCQEQKISKEIEFDNLDHLCGHFLIFHAKKAIATARVRQKRKNILKIETRAATCDERGWCFFLQFLFDFVFQKDIFKSFETILRIFLKIF